MMTVGSLIAMTTTDGAPSTLSEHKTLSGGTNFSSVALLGNGRMLNSAILTL
jgi:hypothetical protein